MYILKRECGRAKIKKLTQADNLRKCKTNDKAPHLFHTAVQSYFRDSSSVFQ